MIACFTSKAEAVKKLERLDAQISANTGPIPKCPDTDKSSGSFFGNQFGKMRKFLQAFRQVITVGRNLHGKALTGNVPQEPFDISAIGITCCGDFGHRRRANIVDRRLNFCPERCVAWVDLYRRTARPVMSRRM